MTGAEVDLTVIRSAPYQGSEKTLQLLQLRGVALYYLALVQTDGRRAAGLSLSARQPFTSLALAQQAFNLILDFEDVHNGPGTGNDEPPAVRDEPGTAVPLCDRAGTEVNVGDIICFRRAPKGSWGGASSAQSVFATVSRITSRIIEARDNTPRTYRIRRYETIVRIGG
jgi:hypothetical protein